MSTPIKVSDYSARMTIQSVERLIEAETAHLRGQLASVIAAAKYGEQNAQADRRRMEKRIERDGQMMVVIAIGCGVFGLLAGFLLCKVIA